MDGDEEHDEDDDDECPENRIHNEIQKVCMVLILNF